MTTIPFFFFIALFISFSFFPSEEGEKERVEGTRKQRGGR